MILKINSEDLEISSRYQCLCLSKGDSFGCGCQNYGIKNLLTGKLESVKNIK